MTKTLKKAKSKVKGWNTRFDDPFFCYQMLISRNIKGYAWDSEEHDFFYEVEKMLKSGEMKILHPSDDGYAELRDELLQKRNLPYISVYTPSDNMPTWASNYFKQFGEWQSTAPKSNNYIVGFRNLLGYWYDCEPAEPYDGFIFKWKTENDKLMFLLKFG